MTTTVPAEPSAAGPHAAGRGGGPAKPVHFGLAVFALAVGGFAIGTTEFVTMGLLPQIADGVAVSIPVGGHLISAYALGVVVGAPLLAIFGARLPRRGLLVALMVVYAVFNALSALVSSFELLALARFLDGLPHGGYFGVASLVAASLAPRERKGRAVAMVMLGLSIANVIGVPATTWLGQTLGWRAAYWTAALLALATVALTLVFVPSVPGNAEAGGRRELSFFTKPQVWLTLVAGAIGFGGMFAVFSYVAPLVTETGGLPDVAVPVFLLALGLGMVAGTWLAGELADWSIMRSLLASSITSGVVLLAFAGVIGFGWWALPVCFLITLLGSVLVVNLQLRLMQVAGDAETLGAAMNHASLNVANALGAWLGGLVISAGLGYRATALVGAGLSMTGFGILLAAAALQLRTNRAAVPTGR